MPLSVMHNVILSVEMLNVIMLTVAAPQGTNTLNLFTGVILAQPFYIKFVHDTFLYDRDNT
jgi:hypothetical protein